MQSSQYYRDSTERARRIIKAIIPSDTSRMLEKLARDYDDIAIDLELGAIEIVHRNLLPQRNHPG